MTAHDQAESRSGAAAAESKIHVELKNVSQIYPTVDASGESSDLVVVKDLSLNFDEPGINMLLGPSGCGKSTVLRMMGGVRPIGVVTPTAGEVFIDQQPCNGAHPDAAMVFQRYSNRPDLTVAENIGFPFRFELWRERVSASERQARVDEIMHAVGLADKASLRPAQLSGGQNQRVALARALVVRPRVLLMDEPFGALDAQTREDMQRLLVSLYDAHPCLIVFVTHDVTEALVLGDRVIVLSTQPATVADDFTITEPRPRTSLWQRSTDATRMEERVLEQLHKVSPGKGQVRVTV